MAQKPDIGVIKEEFSWLDQNVIFENEDIKKNTQLFKQVRQKLGFADNIIHVGSSVGMDILQNVIYLILEVGYQVDVFHDQNLESFLAAASDNNKYKAVI